jgi:hypothetical protein
MPSAAWLSGVGDRGQAVKQAAMPRGLLGEELIRPFPAV